MATELLTGISGEIAQTLDGSYYKGCGSREGLEREIVYMSYQNVVGTLSPGAHCGSYNGQDAYNDLLITENHYGINLHRKRTGEPSSCEYVGCAQLYARPAGCRSSAEDPVQNDLLLRGGETSQTLDSSYWKGTGARNGKEREILAEESVCMSGKKGHNGITEDGTATTLTAQEKEHPMVGSSIVRRLTPTECARLQGYPDDWCNLGEWTDTAGKVHKPADTPVYKAYGNSIALPFWAWLTRRISAQYEGKPPTLGSLFDGIGGFPLCWARVNGPDSVRWASEIEDFCIAVTKHHFGDEETGLVGDIRQYL